MAIRYGISFDWIDDTTFRIGFSNDYGVSDIGFCVATFVNKNAIVDISRGVTNIGVISNNGLGYAIVGLPYFWQSSGAGTGTFSFAGIVNQAPAFIDKVFVFVDTSSGSRNRAYNFAAQWAQNGNVAANAWLEAQTWSEVFTRSQATPLSTPTGLYADQITSDSARVSWNAVENATSYKVEYRRQGDTTWNE